MEEPGRDRAGLRAAVSAVQHRPALDPELPGAGECRRSTPSAAGPFSARVFAGQRAEGFYVDLGAVFDLGDLRGFAGDHAGGGGPGLMNGMPGVNSTADVNVHTLALQIPVDQLTQVDAVGPGGPRRRHRRLDHGEPPTGASARQRLATMGTELRERPVDPGVAPRKSADERAPHRYRRQGPVERAATDVGRRAIPRVLRQAAAAAAVADVCIRASSPTWRRTTAARTTHGRTSRRSSSRGSRRG